MRVSLVKVPFAPKLVFYKTVQVWKLKPHGNIRGSLLEGAPKTRDLDVVDKQQQHVKIPFLHPLVTGLSTRK